MQGAGRITVHLVDGIEPSAVTQRLAADLSVQGAVVSFDHQKRSIRELTAISEDIRDARPFASLGAKLQSWGVHPDTNSVEVGVTTTVAPQLLAEVRTVYGDAVTVVQKPVAIAALSRLDDISPFYGGDRNIRSGR